MSVCVYFISILLVTRVTVHNQLPQVTICDQLLLPQVQLMVSILARVTLMPSSASEGEHHIPTASTNVKAKGSAAAVKASFRRSAEASNALFDL